MMKNLSIKKCISAFALSVMLLVPGFVSCNSRDQKKYDLPVQELVITRSDGTQVSVMAEIAKKQEERNYGFMNRTSIPDGTGMLFVFEWDEVLSFWMKNTPHPLSIAYIDAQGTICDIYDMEPFDERSVASTRSVRFALEVPQGWYDKAGVHPGDVITLSNGTSLRKM